MQLRRILIVGATSSIAQHCARLWATEADTMLLLGRDTGRLERVARDLQVRNPQLQCTCRTLDFLDPAEIESCVAEYAATAAIDLALIAHGDLPDQARCQSDPVSCRNALEVNGVSPVLFMQAIVATMESAGKGWTVVLGSVAGDRGRKSNYIYGAAKALVDRCAQGVQHRLASCEAGLTLVKPGPTRTPMTAHLLENGAALAEPAAVAERIVRGVARKRAVIYAPGKWRLIMLVIRHLPRFVFNRLDI